MSYSNILVLLFLLTSGVGLYGLRRWRVTKAWKAIAFGTIGLALLSWPPAAKLTARPFVGRYVTQQERPIGNAEVIVVLAGDVDQPTRERPYVLIGQDTYKRVMHAAWLFHRWRALPILVTGGPTTGHGEPAAVAMRRLLQEQGIPASMIWIEDRSHSTYENAVFGTNVLREHGIRQIALVVDADSMLRAEKCFRKQGVAVTPMPCWVQDVQFRAGDLLPGWQAIHRHEILLHEGVGLFWYWLRGRV